MKKYKVVCAWCGKFMSGDKNAKLENTSHSICEQCKKEQLRSIKK